MASPQLLRSAGGRAPASSRARAAAGGVLQAASQLLSSLLGLGVMIYLSRTLGAAHYGLYAVSMMFTGWLAASVGVVSGSATIRLVAGHEHGARYAVTMLQLVGLLGTAAALLISLTASALAAFLHADELAPLFVILAWNVPLSALAGVYTGILSAQGRFGPASALLPLGFGVQIVGTAILMPCGWGERGAVLAVVASVGMQFCAGWYLSGISPLSAHRVSFAHLWHQSRLFAGMQLIVRIGQNVDLLALKHFGGSVIVSGHYAGAQNISLAATTLFAATGNSTLQHLSQSRLEGDVPGMQRTASLMMRMTLIYAGVLAAHAALAGDIARLILGREFSASGPLLAIMLWVSAARVVGMSARTLIASAGERATILPHLCVLLVSAFCAFAWFIPRGGALAAAWVALALSFLLTLFSIGEGLALTEITFPWATLMRVSVAAGGAAALARVPPLESLHVLVRLALATLVYGGLLVALGEERPRLRQLENFWSGLLHVLQWRPKSGAGH